MINNVSQVYFKSNIHAENNKDEYYSKDDVFYYMDDEAIKFCEQRRGNKPCPNSFNDINCTLRQKGCITPDDNKMISALDKAFEKLPGLEEEQTLYRGLYGMHLDEKILNAKIGEIITPDNGYAQVTANEYYAESYLPSESCNPVLFVMKCPKGSKVSFSNHTGTGAKEGFLPRDTKFKIINKEKINIPIVYGRDYHKDRYATVYELEYQVN